MSNIRYLESQLDLFWRNRGGDFAGFDKPQIVPAATVRGNAPMYLQRYIDTDPNSFYMFVAGDPLRHEDISRNKACELFDQFFYEHMRMPSSYDIDAGGDLSREQAIDKEVLPAKDDSAYKSFFEEQLAKADAEAAAAEKKAKDDEFEKKMGFRRDDPDIIDVDVDGAGKAEPASGRSVQQGTGTAVGMPKKIWYGCDFHIPAGGGQLGYSGGGRLHGRRGASGYLREEDAEEMLDEALAGSKRAKLEELIAMCEPHSELWNALLDIEEKFNLDECDACGDPECADGEKCGLKESEADATCEEIDEIIGEDEPGAGEMLSEYAKIEDEAEEDDEEVLSESVIRHANMLARELW